MMTEKLTIETMAVSPWHSRAYRKMKISFSTLVPWLTRVSLASSARPNSGISWSTKITKPMAVMKPLKNGRLSTLSKNPRRVSPAMSIMAPDKAVATPTTRAISVGSSSPELPCMTLALTIAPVSKEPAASGPTTKRGQLPKMA